MKLIDEYTVALLTHPFQDNISEFVVIRCRQFKYIALPSAFGGFGRKRDRTVHGSHQGGKTGIGRNIGIHLNFIGSRGLFAVAEHPETDFIVVAAEHHRRGYQQTAGSGHIFIAVEAGHGIA
ncbi:hypothetical protein DSECCO2_528490 [anaerobic digester metagenome]